MRQSIDLAHDRGDLFPAEARAVSGSAQQGDGMPPARHVRRVTSTPRWAACLPVFAVQRNHFGFRFTRHVDAFSHPI